MQDGHECLDAIDQARSGPHYEPVGFDRPHRYPGQLAGGQFGLGGDRSPSGGRDEGRDPVPGAEGRVDPLDDRRCGPAPAGDPVRDRGELLPERGHQEPIWAATSSAHRRTSLASTSMLTSQAQQARC